MLSLGQLYDNGCKVLLNKHNMYAIKEKGVVIEGERNHRGGLLDIILPSNPNDKKSIQTNNHTTTVGELRKEYYLESKFDSKYKILAQI